MNLIWKRPDGYHGATPSDFTTISIDGHSKLWVHKTDHDTFPFRISGGWEEEEQSKKLNNLVNLIGKPDTEWVLYLSKIYADNLDDDPKQFSANIITWLDELSSLIKGGNWEIEIIKKAIEGIKLKLIAINDNFVKPSGL